MWLNIGCGGRPFEPPWVNIDKTFGTYDWPCHPDYLADLMDLPYEDESIERIYCGHVLQHIALEEVPTALGEIRRVLKDNGELCIIGPDYDRTAEGEWAYVRKSIWPGLPHSNEGPEIDTLWCPSATRMLALVREVFPDAKEVPIVDLDPVWPAITFLTWQFAILA